MGMKYKEIDWEFDYEEEECGLNLINCINERSLPKNIIKVHPQNLQIFIDELNKLGFKFGDKIVNNYHFIMTKNGYYYIELYNYKNKYTIGMYKNVPDIMNHIIDFY